MTNGWSSQTRRQPLNGDQQNNMFKPVYFKKGTNWQAQIGLIDKQRKVFVKKIYEKHQKLWQINGYGIHTEFFFKKLLPENYQIILIELDTGRRYGTTAQIFLEKGQEFEFEYGKQIFLSVDNWRMPILTEEQKYKLFIKQTYG